MAGDEGDAYAEGDCAGPWGCKQYADTAVLPPECETDDDCADGFECADGQCVPAAEEDVTEDSSDAIEHGLYPLEIATEQEPEAPECHCGVGYACEDGFCVKIGGNENNNPPNNDEEDVSPEPQPEADVVAQEDVSPEPTEDVVAEGDANTATFDVTADEGSVGDVATQDASAEVAAEVEADAETNEIAEAPEVVADSGAETELFAGAKCTITCLPEYTMVRIFWAFTSSDVANGTEFSIPKAQLCQWGEMAFEFNCFIPDGKWGDYQKATVSCTPNDYELEDTGLHGKVKFDESCW